MTYPDAMAYCREHYNTILAVFSSPEEAQEIQDAVPRTANQRAWVGLNDLDTHGQWVMEEASLTDTFCGGNCVDIPYWGTLEPNPQFTIEACAVARAKGLPLDELLADIGCTANSVRFICHKEPVFVDECADGSHNCDANAICTDTDNGFTCECIHGYEGDGTDGNCHRM